MKVGLCAGYSIWTNHDYKSPLLASAVACLIGNLAYCLSYDLGAVWLLFLARLITGLGATQHIHFSVAFQAASLGRSPGIRMSFQLLLTLHLSLNVCTGPLLPSHATSDPSQQPFCAQKMARRIKERTQATAFDNTGTGGAGSARTVNRRYIAIFVAFKDRTWASALFVSLSAVGMALGPLLALPLSHFPTLHFAGLTFDHVRAAAIPPS